MKHTLWPAFIDVVKRDVVPALGCTEPVSVALAAAIAVNKLNINHQDITAINVLVSANLMKNGMGVTVPGTGMVGLEIAAAAGAVAGDSSAQLEVLKNLTTDNVAIAKTMLDKKMVTVNVANVSNILYSKVTIFSANHSATVTIADSHTHVLAIEEDGITTYIAEPQNTLNPAQKTIKSNPFIDACAQDIFDFATQAPLAEIEFIKQAYQLNNDLSIEGLQGNYGLQVGATFQRSVERGLLAGGLLTDVLLRTAAASDARMGGAMKPAMSNSGSGNQGIAATMPVVVVAEFIKADDEQLIRALMLSHLMAIYIKSYQNKLSALCGATTASMGAVAGMTWLLGGDIKQISAAINSMIGDIAGMICDGAKTSCAMKVSSSAGSAVKSALMALDGIGVTGNEGIVAHDVDSTIRNLSALANGSMTQTDVQILDIMINK
ncbi:serine dehydratase subunit alpha family protein [Photobacterium kishitanii]|uniref:L-cysteine desulfidase family protein n=1 Tax=Photobacterium kishitanii TaxID=318456 RepID=UPI0005D326CB|nr:L-serine ammonia-lyase, iron-sulfur-dependent, subunit alpha [Photobacterium kishitanii]KJG08535.1 membrane protein [Photobacterium kishitanii]PSV06556.1 serine dehydratase subunit alpha family protein [Photobacterium kishitanii]PSV77439.1 serine dehydratase subunit alpha family protein [Photobacterium kishitanii]PSW62190.1 serine dehydratase subunit alpha family protein [Photobacterium kishitanii]